MSELKPTQVVSADVARKSGIPVHPEAESVALYGMTVDDDQSRTLAIGQGVTITDKRPSREVQEFEPFTTILDRILIRRIQGAEEDAVSGFDIPKKYREPEAVGMVVCAGDGVVLGNQWFPMEKFLKVGDQVRYGEHSAEKYDVKDDPDFPDGEYFICRLQDLRGVRRLKNV